MRPCQVKIPLVMHQRGGSTRRKSNSRVKRKISQRINGNFIPSTQSPEYLIDPFIRNDFHNIMRDFLSIPSRRVQLPKNQSTYPYPKRLQDRSSFEIEKASFMYAADCNSNVDFHNVRSKTTFNTHEVNIFDEIWFPQLN